MPDDTSRNQTPATSTETRQQESAPPSSDSVFPKQRGPGEFGTHGGPARKPKEQSKPTGIPES
ncbi:MAG: hypothetical protein HY901_28275 [Deltaproteobacteria bacterium]|nr:hypothetical protein [Deltaproteobacteria bacterium]